MTKIQSIRRWEENPIYWRTESGMVLGFQSDVDRDCQTMTISDGEKDGKRYTSRYGVVDDGKFCRLCNKEECGIDKRKCEKREEGTACRHYHDDGTPRTDGEASYYVELDE